MCDCYHVQCQCENGKIYPVHLGDFETGRHEVAIQCPACFDPQEHPWITFKLMEGDDPGYGEWFALTDPSTRMYEKDDLMTIVFLTPLAVSCAEQNHPNCACYEIDSGGFPEGFYRVKRTMEDYQ